MTSRRAFLKGGLVLPFLAVPSHAQLFLNEVSGFSARQLETTLIAQGTGTAVGGMTGNSGLAAAFDGNTSQTAAASAANSAVTSGYALANSVGKNWGSGTKRRISRVTAYAPNNTSFISSGSAVGYRIVGSDTNDPTTATILASGTTGSGNGTILDVTTGISTGVAYRYHWIMFEGNGSNVIACAELVFYELA